MNNHDKFERFSGNKDIYKNLKERSVLAALFMATGQGTDFMLRIISTIILARLLVPEHFGLVAMVTAVIGMAEVIRDLGLSTATIQRNDIKHQQISNLFWINVTAGMLFFLFFTAISPVISFFYHEPKLVAITIAISTSFVWYGLNAQHQALLHRQLKQGKISLIQILANLCSVIVAVLMAINGYEYWALVWREIIRNFLVTVGIWLACPWVPGLPKLNAGTREFLKFGRDLSITHFIIGIISKVDGLLIGKFSGAAVLGVYRQAYQLIMVPIDQINGPILSVSQPALSRLNNDPARYQNYYSKILYLIGFITIPLGIFVMVYAREIILFLLGEKWAEAIPFLRIFAFAASIRPIISTSAIVLITCGKSKEYLLVALGHSLFLMAFFGIGLKWGAIGIAIAHVSTSFVLMVPKLYYSFLGTPVKIGHFFNSTKIQFLATLFMLGILFIQIKKFPLDNIFFQLLMGGTLAILSYLSIIFLSNKGREDVIMLYKDIASSLNLKAYFCRKR